MGQRRAASTMLSSAGIPGCFQQILLDVLAEADEALLEVFRPGLPDLSDVEVDEAHGEHVIGEECA